MIIAIGAQNAFILRQGLLCQYVFILCLIAACSDTLKHFAFNLMPILRPL